MRGRKPTYTPCQAEEIRKVREREGLSLRQLRERFGGCLPTLAAIVYKRGAYQDEVIACRRTLAANNAEIERIKVMNKHLTAKIQSLSYVASQPKQL